MHTHNLANWYIQSSKYTHIRNIQLISRVQFRWILLLQIQKILDVENYRKDEQEIFIHISYNYKALGLYVVYMYLSVRLWVTQPLHRP